MNILVSRQFAHISLLAVLLGACCNISLQIPVEAKKKTSATDSVPASSDTSTTSGDSDSNSNSGSASGKAPLQGGVQDSAESVDLNSGVPMAAPVLPKKALQGGVEQVDKSKPLSGNAQDEDDDGIAMQGKTDSMPGKTLQGNANMQNGMLNGADPDADDQQLQVLWDKWRNRFLWAVQNGVQEQLNNSDDGNLRWDPRKQTVVRQFPLGTEAWFVCKITNDRRITNFKMLHSSGYPNYDKAVTDAVAALNGSALLKFPSRSRRAQVEQAAGIKTAEQSNTEFFHFGDVERYRTPAQ